MDKTLSPLLKKEDRIKLECKKDIIDVDDLKVEEVEQILKNGDSFKEVLERDIKKVPALRAKTVINMFYEPSTRTKISFELAAKRLGADVINFSASESSLLKGESDQDTLDTIKAMKADLAVIRHKNSGYVNYLAQNTDIPVINAGDGRHAHPTQALLDLYTIRESFDRIKGLKVAIIGDIKNSRVARSDIKLFNRMGMDVTIVAPSMLMPENMEMYQVNTAHKIDDVIKKADVVYMLRMQFERQSKGYYPSIREYCRFLSLDLTRAKKMKEDAIIMHPGPVNRNIEIQDCLFSDKMIQGKIKINEQVTNGVAVRMALLYFVFNCGGK